MCEMRTLRLRLASGGSSSGTRLAWWSVANAVDCLRASGQVVCWLFEQFRDPVAAHHATIDLRDVQTSKPQSEGQGGAHTYSRQHIASQ